MTTKEFSDAFDTLIAAYNHKSEFGDQTSLADVTLDEYEKSVFLTQAQDQIVKNYFSNRTNSVGEGFDDSIRRQADFSSLITTYHCARYTDNSDTEWSEDSINLPYGNLSLKGLGNKYQKINVSFSLQAGAQAVGVNTTYKDGVPTVTAILAPNNSIPDQTINALQAALRDLTDNSFTVNKTDSTANLYLGAFSGDATPGTVIGSALTLTLSTGRISSTSYDERGRVFSLPDGDSAPLVLLMLNERVTATYNGVKHYLVVVPISYTEYDRQMSRAYAQPLKKQAWRLFQGDPNADATTRAEIIANEKYTLGEYIIRYVRRPRPIILTDLDLVDSQVPLEIDGENKVTECELNPILHMDILEEAVRLALGSKGIETADARRARQQAERAQRQS